MPTRARYALIEVGEKASIEAGPVFETGRRSEWTLRLSVSRLSPAASVTVAVETSPRQEETYFEEAYSFGAVNATGVTLARPDDEDDPVPIGADDLYMRGRVTAITGTAVLELLAWAPFFRTGVDKHLVRQDLREWKDGYERTVERAEDKLVRVLLSPGRHGVLGADVLNPRFPDAMREAVAVQADHDYARHRMRESKDPSQAVTARGMSDVSQDARRILREFTGRRGVWRGRG